MRESGRCTRLYGIERPKGKRTRENAEEETREEKRKLRRGVRCASLVSRPNSRNGTNPYSRPNTRVQVPLIVNRSTYPWRWPSCPFPGCRQSAPPSQRFCPPRSSCRSRPRPCAPPAAPPSPGTPRGAPGHHRARGRGCASVRRCARCV